ncbi:MAG TPA: DUF1028 domain-containing protein [Gammaproteobacteria bacterium]|nr:DUF1028 domain-containing protein [Gammaproteobacteria bacterium]
MRILFLCLLVTVWLQPIPLLAQPLPGAVRPVHTYSIVARDPDTGELGVAVQSHWFSVGTLVPWARAGVGAVATQSFIDVRYGMEGLDLMGEGKSAQQALDALLRADPTPEVRQVGMIDAQGRIAQHTGRQCIQYAGHLAGDNFAVQANLMVSPGVPEAMAEAFRAARGSLAERMLAALEAAQASGGDLRGKQSAALLVVRAQASEHPWQDTLVDLHVEDHPAPLRELRRLLTLDSAYDHMNDGDHALERNDVETALAQYGAAEALAPGNVEMKFWHAVALVNAQRVDAALPVFAEVFRVDAGWRDLVPRLVEAQLLAADTATLARIEHIGLQEEVEQ